MNNELLPEYQKYLSAKNLVQDQYIIYYAYWASKFLIFSNNNKELNNDLQIEKFIYHLESQRNIKDWQIRQAHDSVRLYFNHAEYVYTWSILRERRKKRMIKKKARTCVQAFLA
jgi:hypothetical protein